jgi:hypothetical protein
MAGRPGSIIGQSRPGQPPAAANSGSRASTAGCSPLDSSFANRPAQTVPVIQEELKVA